MSNREKLNIGGNMARNVSRLILIFLSIVFSVSVVHAEQLGGIEYSGSGFFTLAAGKMLGGTRGNVEDYNCPCFISDYAQASVYDGRSSLQWKPDSRFGMQGSASYHDVSVTTQVVARGSTGTADLEWLYGSYNLNDKITLQAGRKRLPMFYYSDVQDVGFSLPWTHLPPGPYGWEAVNYNGVNVRYQDRWSGWAATADLLAGDESNHNSGYWKIYNGRQSQSSVKWSHIVGGDLTFSNDWIETRAVYLQSDTLENYGGIAWDTPTLTYIPQSGPIYPPAKQQLFGLAINADFRNWLVRSEFIQINHPGLTWRDHAQLVGVGYRFGKWQPMVTWSEYQGTVVSEGVIQPSTPSYPILQPLISLTLRYDITPTSDLKAQYDSLTDRSDLRNPAIYGNSRLLTFTYDRVF